MMQLLNGKIPVDIQRKSVKGINISVSWDERVKVTVPENLDEGTIRKVMQRRAPWIESKLKEIRRRIDSHPVPIFFASGETVWVLGKPMTLEVQEGRGGVMTKDTRLIVQVEGVRREVVRATLVTWLSSLAQKILAKKVEKFSRVIGVKPEEIELKNWKRRWGLCRTDRGILEFNWRLVQLPENLIDYIVVHELVHLKHAGHVKKFWDCMSKIIPDYLQQKERLKEWNSALLW